MRARNIKPGFFVRKKTGKLSSDEKILYIGLWCLADREGFYRHDPEEIHAQIFPYDRKINVEKLLCNLMSNHLITFNDVFGYIPKFTKHQRPHPHEAKSDVSENIKKTLINQCNEMSCNVMKCTFDIMNDDIMNDDITDFSKTEKSWSSDCLKIYEKLMSKVKAHRPSHKNGKRDADLKHINLMLSRDKRNPERVLKLLEWYPIGQEYIPEIFSAKSLRDKFEKLENAYCRKHKMKSTEEKPDIQKCKQNIIRFVNGKYGCDAKNECKYRYTAECNEKQAVKEITEEKGVA